MIISFFGHSKCNLSDTEVNLLKEQLIALLTNNEKCVFYLGGYGDFDNYCLSLLNEFKTTYNNIETVFVTPYISKNYTKLQNAKNFYDYTLYPPLEKEPLKLAIIKRNEYIISNSNLVIFYLKTNFGGAYTAHKYAKRKRIPYINIAD